VSFAVAIPVPPSVNALYANVRHGRIKTRRYARWIEAAGWELLLQHPTAVHGRYHLTMTLPRIRGDPDNRVKPISDLLVAHGLIEDDSVKFCAGIVVVPTNLKGTGVIVRVEEVRHAGEPVDVVAGAHLTPA
jgi:Holliday junction resolvase RusA-like endonuclease